jgi:CheY-like chemotaxis protein
MLDGMIFERRKPAGTNRILVVGSCSTGFSAALLCLAAHGWTPSVVRGLEEAVDALEKSRFDVVLSAELLPDGSGYDLAQAVARQASTLWVGVPLSESCLWLPVVEHGRKVLGRRAFNARVIEAELEALLDTRGPQVVASTPDIASSMR